MAARVLAIAAILAALTAVAAGVLPVGDVSGAHAAGGWWKPPARPTWYWQLQGSIDNRVVADVYDIDAFENNAAEVAALHAQGRHVICYVDVGTAESFRPDYGAFPPAVLGRSNGWPGERWLDIRQLGVVEPIMAARLQICREKGFDAVEPDNMEGYANNSGFPLTAPQQLTYNDWIADQAHSLGMAVLQKNDGEQSGALQTRFDGALTEQCNQYRECGLFQPYLAAGKPVINAEYRLATKRFCAADVAAGMMGARYNLKLNGKRFQPCW